MQAQKQISLSAEIFDHLRKLIAGSKWRVAEVFSAHTSFFLGCREMSGPGDCLVYQALQAKAYKDHWYLTPFTLTNHTTLK